MENQKKVFVVGVGITQFFKPSQSQTDYPEFASMSVRRALNDAKLRYQDIQQACCGYVYGDSTSGQNVLYEVGLTGIPIFNINNNCSTGSSAIFMANQIIQSGNADCVLALGFEKMPMSVYKNPQTIGYTWTDRQSPITKHVEVLDEVVGNQKGAPIMKMFAGAGKEHMEKYGSTPEHFMKIAQKNFKHGLNNPNAIIQKEYSLEEIKKNVYMDPLTRLQCTTNASGSAAVILASEKFVIDHQLQDQAVEILGISMKSDNIDSFNSKTCTNIVGTHLNKLAREEVFSKTQYKPTDVNVVELHDCFTTNELVLYEALGLCNEGEGHKMVERGDNTYGGKYVVNPDGGLLCKGHPFGATGVAMCVELCLQLRQQAGKRQVPNAKLGLQQNYGMGSSAVVALYKKYNQNYNYPSPKL